MANEETMTIIETAPDGTETVIEITTTQNDEREDDGESLIEEVVEALFDVEIGDEENDLEFDENTGGEYEAEAADFNVGDAVFDPDMLSTGAPATTAADNAAFDADDADSAAETAGREAHAQAATDAQAAADEFVGAGDYAAAAEAREAAENEAWEAGDDSMLGAYDSVDLETAAGKQEDAEYYEQQQATHAREGDYEAAREDASNAAYAMGEADFHAGGADHTGQADAEQQQMEWAVHEENQADYYNDNAASYAAEGDFDNAEMYAAEGAAHQNAADHHGDLGEHGGEMAIFDPSSEVDSGGTYDAGYVDTNFDAVDTGFDSGVDASMDTGFDAADDV